jgi:NAD(P)H-nitrite reductase large subunit
MIEEFDVVALTTSLPAYGLIEGDTGTVVDIHPAYKMCTVEFTRNEKTVAVVGIHAEDLRVVWREQAAAYAD